MTFAATAWTVESAITGDQQPDSSADSATAGRVYDLSRLRSRDPEEFDRLVSGESSRIQQLVERLLGWNEREDITQEVFVRAWQSINRFRGDSDVTTWLYSIAVNLCRNHRRWQSIRQRFLNSAGPDLTNCRLLTNAGQSDVEHVYRAMNRLSHSDRETIVLCCLEEKSVDQVAKLLKTKKNTIEVRLHRARERLKQILDTFEHE